jgi:hypothetical protein
MKTGSTVWKTVSVWNAPCLRYAAKPLFSVVADDMKLVLMLLWHVSCISTATLIQILCETTQQRRETRIQIEALTNIPIACSLLSHDKNGKRSAPQQHGSPYP